MMTEGTNHSTDNPVVKPRAPNKRNHVVPHYLRASTGSCHDACKYGKPQEFKERPWQVSRRSSAPLPNGEKTMNIQIFVDKKLKNAVQTDKLEPSSVKESSSANERMKRSSPSSKKTPVLDSSKPIKQQVRSFTKSPSPEVPRIMKKTVRSPGKLFSLVTQIPIKLEVASSAKKAASTKSAFSDAKERNTSQNSFTGLGSKRMSEAAKTIDSARTSRVAVKKVLTLPTVALSSKRTSKVEITPSSDVRTVITNVRNKTKIRKNENKAEYKEPVAINVEEKTLHMIETREDCLSVSRSGNQLIQSPSPLSPESLNSSSRTNSHSLTSHEVDDQDELDSKYTKADNGITLDSEGPESMKLKFRRGKVVEIQSETNSARKLRFREGRILEDDQGENSGARRRIYRRRATENDKKESKAGPVKVVLKHQDVETKKDTQVLLNNVIEQTASKLVETRKSKVKALVGAFETVISLQERKPSTADR